MFSLVWILVHLMARLSYEPPKMSPNMLLEYRSETLTKANWKISLHIGTNFQIILLSSKHIQWNQKIFPHLGRKNTLTQRFLAPYFHSKSLISKLNCSVLHTCTLYTLFLQAKGDATFQKADFPSYVLDSTTMPKHSHYFVSLQELSEISWTFHRNISLMLDVYQYTNE